MACLYPAGSSTTACLTGQRSVSTNCTVALPCHSQHQSRQPRVDGRTRATMDQTMHGPSDEDGLESVAECHAFPGREGRARLLRLALKLVIEPAPRGRRKHMAWSTPAHPRSTCLVLGTEYRHTRDVGIDSDYDCIPLHGSLRHLRCPLSCGRVHWADYGASITAGDAVSCPLCAATCQARVDAGKDAVMSGSSCQVCAARRGTWGR